MAQKKTQIGFRVTEAFRKQIEAESITRDLSVQDLITCALEVYFKTPPDWDHAVVHFVIHEGVAEERIRERQSWTNLWLKFIDAMPRQKVLLLAETMKLDLRHYKSSRRKTDRKQNPRREAQQ